MRRKQQSGFALLFVFAMASIIAITLYISLPAITFEAQRDKEELLIQRGEQYKRGIQLYVRKFKRFPAKMEDLDNANGTRFLRHHYLDPLTGKDEWRLIHAGPGGVLLDSLVKTKETDKKEAGQTSITELLGTGGLPETDPAGNLALRKRPSDQPGAPGSASSGAGSSAAPGAPIPADPPQGALPEANPQGAFGRVAGAPFGAVPGQATPGQIIPGQGPAGAGTTLPGRLPGTPNPAGASAPTGGGISAGGGIGFVPAPVPGQTPVPGQVTQQLFNPAAPNGAGPAGATPNAQGAADAAGLIRNLLTTPRPGGLAGLQANTGNQTIGGGIAGVASTVKSGSGIKIYNDQDEYKKWEFVYDATKDTQGAGGVPQQGRPPGTPVGQQPPQTNSGFGGAGGAAIPGVPVK